MNHWSNRCTDDLTDIEYLEYTIPHHQVTIDMSNLLIPKRSNSHRCEHYIFINHYNNL